MDLLLEDRPGRRRLNHELDQLVSGELLLEILLVEIVVAAEREQQLPLGERLAHAGALEILLRELELAARDKALLKQSLHSLERQLGLLDIDALLLERRA